MKYMVIAISRYICFRSCINIFSFKIIFMLLEHSSEILSLQTAEYQYIFDMQVLHGYFSQLSLMATTLPFRGSSHVGDLPKASNVHCLQLF